VTRHGLNKSWVVRRITQSFANLVDGGVEAVVEVYEGVGGPERLAHFFAGDDFAWPRQQSRQYLEGLLLQLDLDPVFPQFPRGEIGLEDSEPYTCLGLL